MDWTTNPLVALYFAVRQTRTGDDNQPIDSAVYVLISDPPRYTDFNRPGYKITPVRDLATKVPPELRDHEDYGLEEVGSDATEEGSVDQVISAPSAYTTITYTGTLQQSIPSPFEIKENVIYHPPHISPRLRAQDSVLLACHQPLQALEERDSLEIVVRHDCHDEIRQRLDQYGVFDRQLFPDLDGIAKWLRYRVFESKGSL